MSDLFPRGSLVIVSPPSACIGFYQGVHRDGERHKVKLLDKSGTSGRRDKRVRYVRAGRLHRPMVWRPAGGYLRIAAYAETLEEASR